MKNKVYDVLYKRTEDKKGRGVWLKCGVMLQKISDGKMSLKLDAVPVGKEFDGWFTISERKGGYHDNRA